MRPRGGQAALSLVFLIGGIIIFSGITLAILVITFINSSFGLQAANRALAVAQSGVDDALLKLSRNKDFSTTSSTIPLGSYQASVLVTQDSPSADQATIQSTATVSGYRRRLQVIVSIDSLTGQVSVIHWRQI